MNDQPEPAVREPGEAVTVLPYLLGYHPTDTLVMLALTRDGEIHANSTVWTDLPPTQPYLHIAQQYVAAAQRHGALAVILTVVGQVTAERPDPLPYHDLIQVIADTMTLSGVDLLHTTWASSTTTDGHWWCYDDPDVCNGPVPPPEQTPAAVAAIAAGTVAFTSRQELVELLHPDDESVLARRARQITQRLALAGRAPSDIQSTAARTALHAIQTAVDSTQSQHTLTDQDVVQLATALANPLVAAACLGLATGQHAEAAERLWLQLTKSTPAPYRAEPACQLAATAYLRGDRALAGVAVDLAEQASPDHKPAFLLRLVLTLGIPADQVADSLIQLAAEANRVIETGQLT